MFRNYWNPPLLFSLLLLLILSACNGRTTDTTLRTDTDTPTAVDCSQGGVEKDGVCVDASPCEEGKNQCTPGKKCLNTVCVEKDYCTINADCKSPGLRCDKTVGKCVELEQCNNGTCDNDFRCVGGFCLLESDICADLKCGTEANPGVCDLQQSFTECSNKVPGTCDLNEPTHTQCKKGYFCGITSSSTECLLNKCGDTGYCDGGGWCGDDLNSDECKNKQNCQEAKDCLPGHICRENPSGDNECVKLTTLCQDFCGGNQVCECANGTNPEACSANSPQPAKVTCKENSEGCRSKADCLNDKICGDKDTMTGKSSCVKPDSLGACTDPSVHLEKDKAIDIDDVKGMELNLCANEHWYKFTTLHKRILEAVITLHSKDVGNKTLKVELLKEDGTPIDSIQTSHGDTIKVRSKETLKPATYYIKVYSSDSEKQEVRLRYHIEAISVDEKVVTSCEEDKLPSIQLSDSNKSFDKIINSTQDSTTDAHILSCQSQGNDYIFKVDVKERHYYTFKAIPQDARPDNRISLAIRKICDIGSSELFLGCANKNSVSNEPETLSITLEPGSYYLFVKGLFQEARVTASFEEIICSQKDNECHPTDDKILNQCNPSGTAFLPVSCGTTGCNKTLNACNTPLGDTCLTPYQTATEANSRQNPLTGTLSLENFENDYNPANLCTDIGDLSAAGKDFVVKAEVPSNKYLGVLAKTDYGKVSIYLTEDCTKLNGPKACLASTASNQVAPLTPHSLLWENTSNDKKDVYIIFDTEPDNTYLKTKKIEYSVFIYDQICTPDQRECIADGRQSVQCDSLGIARINPHTCNPKLGCGTDGRCLSLPNDKCDPDTDSIIKTENKVTINGNLSGTTDVLPKHTCPIGASLAKANAVESVHPIDIQKNTHYKIDVFSNDFDAIIWLAEGCDKQTGRIQSCVEAKDDSSKGATEKIEFFSTEKKRYYLVIEAYGANTEGAYTITVTQTPATGTPYSRGTCDDTKRYAIRYNDRGSEEKVDCGAPDKCEEVKGKGHCKDGDAKSCSSYKTLFPNTSNQMEGEQPSVVFNTLKITTPPYPSQVGSCYFGKSKAPKGANAIYHFKLQKDQTLNINLKGSTYAQFSAFFQEDCDDQNSCVNALYAQNTQTLSYHSSENDKDVFLIIKEYSDYSSSEDFSFKWNITGSTKCAEGSYSCGTSPGEEKHLLYCSNAQSEPMKIATCASRCLHGFCREPEPTSPLTTGLAEVCGEAPLLNDKTETLYNARHIFTMEGVKQDVDSKKVACTQGDIYKDIFFKVYAKADDIISISARSLGLQAADLFITKSSSCSDEELPCLQHTLIKSEFDTPGKLLYVAKDEGEYVIGLNSANKTLDDYFVLDIKVEHPNPTCSTNPKHMVCGTKSIMYCKNNLLHTFDCKSDCTNTGGTVKCATPQGGFCTDAIPLTGDVGTKTKESIDTTKESTSTVAIKDLVANSCLFADDTATAYSEKYYSIDLKAQEKVTLTITSDKPSDHGFSLYMLDSCSAVDTCIASLPHISTINTMEFVAPKKGTYYLVVDSSSPTPASYRLRWEKTAPPQPCLPGTGYCKDNSTSVQCLKDSSTLEVSCSCDGGLCKLSEQEKRDKCDDVLNSPSFDIEPPSTTSGTEASKALNRVLPLVGMTHSVTLPSGACNLSNEVNGNDAFFKVKLTPKATLRGYVTGSADAKGFPTLFYLENNCNEPELHCLAAKTFSSSTSVNKLSSTLQYANNTTLDQTIIVGVSNVITDQKPDRSLTVFLEVDYPNCDPSDAPACSADGNSVVYCNTEGFKKTYECTDDDNNSLTPSCEKITFQDGTDNKEIGQCKQPKRNQCYDAQVIDLTSSTLTLPLDIEGSYDNATDDFTLSSLSNTCTENVTINGPDQVYRLLIPAKKKISVSVQSTKTSDFSDPAIYLISDCRDFPNSCITGSDKYKAYEGTTPDTKSEAESFTYENASDHVEERFLIVDSFDVNSNGGFKITIENKL